MMVIYLPAKIEFDWTKRFGNENVDGQTDGHMDRRTHQSNSWLHATHLKRSPMFPLPELVHSLHSPGGAPYFLPIYTT